MGANLGLFSFLCTPTLFPHQYFGFVPFFPLLLANEKLNSITFSYILHFPLISHGHKCRLYQINAMST